MEKLPKNWYIAVTHYEVDVEVYKWRNYRFYDKGFIDSDKDWSGYRKRGYTKISLSDFKRLVLKEEDPIYEIY